VRGGASQRSARRERKGTPPITASGLYTVNHYNDPFVPIPRVGDLLIRSFAADRFDLVDVVTLQHVDGPFVALPAAIASARQRNVRAIWQQSLDSRGRPLGDPFRLPDA
jgi:hypothetical protein